jgi:ABC-type lipoprotein release transport system permease subunit
MGALLTIAWRNLWRNSRRTLINVSAAGFGLVLIIIYSGLLEGMMGDAKSDLSNTGMGHVEIYNAQYRSSHHASDAMKNPSTLLAKLQLPEGARAGARVLARGLASSAHGSQGVQIEGVDPSVESGLSGFLRDIRQGTTLTADDIHGILIGEKLAERLQVRVGQKVRLMVQRGDGEMGADLFRVRGIFHAIAPTISRSTAILTSGGLQTLLGVGDAAHQIVIQLSRAEDADSVAASARAALGSGFEVVTYAQLMPVLAAIEKITNTYTLILALFIYLLVGLGILNTTLMSVLERTREFGVLQALGDRPSRIRALVMAESFWIATVSAAFGLALGLWIMWYGSHNASIDFTKSTGESVEMGGAVIRSKVLMHFNAGAAVGSCVFVYIVTILVGLYPAWRVSRLRPAVALRAT